MKCSPGLLPRLTPPPCKVAVLRASRIGDFVCATPAFRSLRAALPDAEIVMIALPMVRDLVLRSPHLDRFVPFPGFPGIAEQFFAARLATDFFRRMQAEEFDLALQLHGSGVHSNPFALLLGARATAGFIRAGDRPGLLDAAVPLPTTGHEIERTLALPLFLGAPDVGRAVEFPLWADDHRGAEELLAGVERPLIGVHAGAREETKRWSPQRFAVAAAELRARWGGTVVVLGEAEEQAAARVITEQVGGRVVNLAGRTSLPQLGAVLTRLDILLTNDSGQAHIAYALGTPTVTIFGRTDPVQWGPPAGGPFRVVLHGVPCRPCDYGTCPIGTPCLEGVTTDAVVDAALNLLGASVTTPRTGVSTVRSGVPRERPPGKQPG